MDWKRVAKKLGRCFAIGTAGVVLFLVSVFGLAQTESGKDQIAKWISNALRGDGMKRVEVEGLSGFIPLNFHVGSIVFSDEKGLWLTLRNLSIQWSPISLIRGVLLIRELQVSSMELHRIPEQERQGETSPRDFLPWLRAASRIRMKHLSAPRIAVGESILGAPALFRLEGRAMLLSPTGERESSLRFERLDGTETKVIVAATLKGEAPSLALRIEAEEASGGIFAGKLQAEGPITLKIEGDGPLRAWRGRVSAHLGRMGSLHAVVGVQAEEELRVCANGVLELPGTGILQGVSPLLGSKIDFDFEVRKVKEGSLRLDGFTLKTDTGLGLQLAGSMSEERKNLEGQFRIRMDDLGRLGESLNVKLTGRLSATGNFSGPLLKPDATMEVDLQEVQIPMAQIGRIQGHYRLEFLGLLGTPFPGFRLSGRGNMENMVLPADAGLEERRVTWQFTLECPTKEMIHLSRLKLEGESGAVDLCGMVDFRGPRGSLDISMSLLDLRKISAILGLELAGTMSFTANVSGDAKDRSLLARVEGKTTVLNELVPGLTPLFGQEVLFGGKIALGEGRTAAVSDFRVDAIAGRVSGEWVMDVPSEEWHAHWKLKVPDLAAFSSLARKTIAGSLEAEGEIEGSLRAINAKAKASAESLVVNGLHFQKGTATFSTQDLLKSQQGDLSLEFLLAGHKMSGKAEIGLQKGRFTISRIMMRGLGTFLEGNVALHLDRMLVDGLVSIRTGDFSELSKLLGEDVNGNLQMEVRLKAGAGQEISFDIKGRDLKGRSAEVGGVRIQGRIHDVFKAPQGSAMVQVREMRLLEGRFEFLDLEARGGSGGLRFAMQAKGSYKEDFYAEGDGALAVSQHVQSLKLKRFRADYGGLPLSLARPARIERSTKGLEVEGAELKLGEGYLKGSAGFSDDSFRMVLDFESLPLDVFSKFGISGLTGTAGGSIRAAGSLRAPAAVVELHVDGLGLLGPRFSGIPPATFRARGRLDQGRLRAELLLADFAPKPFEAIVEVPLNLSVIPLSFSVPRGGQIEGSLSGEVDLAHIMPLASLDDQNLKGKVEIQFSLKGAVRSPVVSGKAFMDQGRYENFRTGTVLENLQVEISGENRRLSIKRMSASDGVGGKVGVAGWVDLVPGENFPFHLKFLFDRARLLRLDHAAASAGGTLVLSGFVSESVLSGELLVGPAVFQIPDRLPPEITELEVIEIHRKDQEIRIEERAGKRGSEVHLDVSVSIPGHVFVRGRGLDSEWHGKVLVRGTVGEPVIAGSLSVVRGTFNFLGKRFTLKKGVIDFTGAHPPLPQVDLLAEAERKGLTVRLEITGSTKEPVVKLSSEPHLPQDEILSQLLFGRSVAGMTPLQAVQLAHALNTLAAGGGLDLIGRTRRILGVDHLEVEPSGEGMEDTKISAGKYLGDRVYLKVERGLGPESGKASAQFQITPNISVETEVGTNAEGGVGVNWKWDY